VDIIVSAPITIILSGAATEKPKPKTVTSVFTGHAAGSTLKTVGGESVITSGEYPPPPPHEEKNTEITINKRIIFFIQTSL